ncbi:protease, partial [Frankia sp. AgKG'84/4]|nr:protease [Frankia sp. AgKG'84/4]
MTKLLLSVHVLAAILAIGPVAVAASMFPPAARAALSAPGDGQAAGTARVLYRICGVYSALGLVAVVFGFFTAQSLGVLGEGWLIAAIVLTTLAALVLAFAVLPTQRDLIDEITAAGQPAAPPAAAPPASAPPAAA